MAKIVSTNGEIVSVHDDKVELGEAYKDFDISLIDGSASEALKAISTSVNPIRPVFKSKVAKEWTFEAPEIVEVWPDKNNYKIITERPAHLYRFKAGAVIKTINDLKTSVEYNLDNGKNETMISAKVS